MIKNHATLSTDSLIRNEKIQILRGVAIITVVIIHSNIPDFTKVIIRPFINFAVALFIFLSGYLTRTTIDDYWPFYSKRLKRVLIPYTIWSLIYSIPKRFESFFLNFLTGRCCGIYYYIFVYAQFVIITPFIIWLVKSKYRVLGWFITPISTLLFRYILNIAGFSVLSSNFNYLFPAWFSYYYLGITLGNKLVTPPKKPSKYLFLYLMTLFLSIIEGFLWYARGDIDMATTQLRLSSIGTSSCFLILCYFYIKDCPEKSVDPPLSHVLLFFGNCSFGIYLSHILIKAVLGKLVSSIMFFPVDTFFILGISSLCVAIGQCILKKYRWVLGL